MTPCPSSQYIPQPLLQVLLPDTAHASFHSSEAPTRLTNIVWQGASVLVSWGWMAGPLGVSAHFPAHSCCGRACINVSALDWETTWGTIWRTEILSCVSVKTEESKPRPMGEPGWEPFWPGDLESPDPGNGWKLQTPPASQLCTETPKDWLGISVRNHA